jgi:hypothetical protein
MGNTSYAAPNGHARIATRSVAGGSFPLYDGISIEILLLRSRSRPLRVLCVLRPRLLLSFELRVKGVKTFEAFREDLLIGQTLLGPTLKDLFNSEAFDSAKLFVLQIRVMD